MTGYWRKTPSIKRLVLRSIPDESTRLAALKSGEVDIIYWVSGELAEEVQRTPGLKLDVSHTAAWWLYFPEQWDPKSPWHDIRVRQAASAGDRPEEHQPGDHARLFEADGNAFVPSHFEFYWQPPRRRYTIRQRRSSCWPRRGIPNGIDAGPFYCDAALLECRRGDRQQPARGRHPRQAAAARTRRVLQELFREEAEGSDHGRQRRVRQRRDPARSLRRQGRRPMPMAAIPISTSCSSSRRSNSITRSARRCSTRCSSWSTSKVIAAPIWQLAALSGVGPRVGQVRHRPDRRLPLDLALRGHHAEGRLICADRRTRNPLCSGRRKKGETAAAGLVYIDTKALRARG